VHLCLEAEARGWTVVSPHHEAAAGFMAEAASRITGKPAVCFGRWRHWHAGEANRKWIYVQQDPTAIGVNRPIDVPLVGDLRAVVPQLSRALGAALPPAKGLAKFMKDGQDELDQLAAETLTKSDGSGDVGVHTSRLIVEATKAFPKDGIMIRDGGAWVDPISPKTA
jgi:acetolactate synthase I/II/III large subunit